MSTGLAGVVLRDLVEGTVVLFGLVLQSLMEEEVGPAQHLANSGRADLSVDVANHVRYLESRYHDVVVGEDEVTCDFPVDIAHPVADLVAHAIELDPPAVSLVLVLDTLLLVHVDVFVVLVDLGVKPVNVLAIFDPCVIPPELNSPKHPSLS